MDNELRGASAVSLVQQSARWNRHAILRALSVPGGDASPRLLLVAMSDSAHDRLLVSQVANLCYRQVSSALQERNR